MFVNSFYHTEFENVLFLRKNFSETEIEILISKYDVDGNTLFTLEEINAIQDGSEPPKLESDET